MRFISTLKTLRKSAVIWATFIKLVLHIYEENWVFFVQEVFKFERQSISLASGLVPTLLRPLF